MCKRVSSRILLPGSLALWLLPALAHAATITASANNTFVSAENAGASFLVANRPTADAWSACRSTAPT